MSLNGTQSKLRLSESALTVQEYFLTARYFKPLKDLSQGKSSDSQSLLIALSLGSRLAFTSRSLTQGIHFTDAYTPPIIAKKALRVSLSDLAALGAKPLGYSVHVHFPKLSDPDTFLAGFTTGLAEDQQVFSLAMFDAKISQTFKDLVISVTAFGEVPQGLELANNTASPGDRIYVTGSVGDAALGLKILDATLPCFSQTDEVYLTTRYFLPEPRIEVGRILGGIATAAVGISDGLLADLERVCTASGTCAYLNWHQIPWSVAFRNVYKSYDQQTREKAAQLFLTGGDDYELLFTVASGDEHEMAFIQERFGIPITLIGHLGMAEEGRKTINLTTKRGEEVIYDTLGFQHIWN